MDITTLNEVIFNGLSLSSGLILTAMGLTITFGVMRVINMAHGDLLMLGAYTAYVVTDPAYLGSNLFVAIPVSFLVVGFVGYLLEIGVIQFLYGRPLDTLLATWGVSLILQQLVLLSFGADLKPMRMPSGLQGNWPIGGLAIPVYRLFIIGVTSLCLFGVYWWFYRTSFGLKIRAVTQNRAMASALGISTRKIDSITFAFASGLAGVAGCIFAYLYTVKYDMGTEYIVEAFMVVTLGGLGQMAGSVASGTLIGTGNSIVSKGLGNDTMAKVIVLVLVIAFLMIRPSGLFTAKERTYD